MSTNRSLCNTSRIAAFGLGQCAGLRPVLVRDRRRPLRWRAWPVAAVVAGLRGTDGLARVPDPDIPGQLGDRAVAHCVDPSRSPRSRRVSPRARAVLPGHPPRSESWPAPAPVAVSPAQGGRSARLQASPRLRPRGAASPASAPASRARRHATIWLEYRPSRRNNAPFSPSGAAS